MKIIKNTTKEHLMRQVGTLGRDFNKSDSLPGISFKARAVHTLSGGETDAFLERTKNWPAAEAWARGGFAKKEDKGRHQIFKQTLSAFVTFHVKAGADTGPGWKCFNNDFPFRHFSLKVTQSVRVKCRCWCLRPWVWLFYAGCWVCSASQFPRASMTSTC